MPRKSKRQPDRIAQNFCRVMSRPVCRFEPDRAWFVVRTNIRCENRASRGLGALGFLVYRPLQRIQRVRRWRLCDEHVQVMPRYIFVGMDPDHPPFGAVRSVHGVEGIVGIQGLPIAVPLAALDRMEAHLATGDKEPAKVVVGMIAELRATALRGASVKVTAIFGGRAEVEFRGMNVRRVTVDLDHLADAA